MSGSTTEYAGAPATRCFRMLSAAASTQDALAFDGPACLRSIQGFNAKAATVFIKLYDKVTAPASTDTPVKTIAVPASAAFVFDFGAGFTFRKGLGFRITTAVADADTGALLAADVLALNLDCS